MKSCYNIIRLLYLFAIFGELNCSIVVLFFQFLYLQKMNYIVDITNKIDALRKKFDEHFQAELKLRQTQLETVETRIAKARKTLHLLRYVLVSSYYKNQEFEVSNDDNITDKQSRIHPAVKRLIGDNLESIQNVGSRRKRFKYDTNSLSENVVEKESEIREENTVNVQPSTSEININESYDMIRNRKQVKKRIIVGNISKFMPAENKDDSTTHKWMMYVRAQKDCEDISTFVEKVVFYLHPSYKPNDIIELSESPFHLSRRGWGEFPLRVRIFFKCELNKPVDIIHNLKLDKTYSGRQTLGNETVVDLSLFDNNSVVHEYEINSIQHEGHIKDEPSTSNSDVNNVSDIKLNDIIFLEHSYTMNTTKDNINQENMEIDSSMNIPEGNNEILLYKNIYLLYLINNWIIFIYRK